MFTQNGVVIPIQTISFYNTKSIAERVVKTKVVIPIQTISFYNPREWQRSTVALSCHTYPNDKLLQLFSLSHQASYQVVIPIQTISFYNLHRFSNRVTQVVVIPIQTISFYN